MEGDEEVLLEGEEEVLIEGEEEVLMEGEEEVLMENEEEVLCRVVPRLVINDSEEEQGEERDGDSGEEEEAGRRVTFRYFRILLQEPHGKHSPGWKSVYK